MIRTLKTAIALAVVALLGACGGQSADTNGSNYTSSSAALEGQVSDEASGSGSSSFDSGGTVRATSKITVSSLASDGTLKVVGTTSLDASGHYKVSVPANATHLVVRAVDSSERALASVVVEGSGAVDTTTNVATMTATTSADAQVYVEMVAQGSSTSDIDTADLATRIDAKVAAQLRAEAETGADVSGQIQALATATMAAQSAKVKATVEGSAKAKAIATSAASAAFRGVLSARLTASASDKALIDVASRTEAKLEAHASAEAVQAILTAGSSSQVVIDAAATAGSKLEADVDAAADAQVVAQAFADFQASIATSAQGSWETSILGQVVSGRVSDTTQASAQVQAVLQAEATAHATLQASADAAFQTAGTVRVDVIATTVVSAYSAFDTEVRARTYEAMATMSTQATLSADLLVIAHGGFLATSG
jgi:hypothetical protein